MAKAAPMAGALPTHLVPTDKRRTGAQAMIVDVPREHSASNANPSAAHCALTKDEWERVNRALGLTRRETEIVDGLLMGKSEAGIAVQLGISINTVHTHLGRVYKKIGVRSAAGLILRVFSACLRHYRGVTFQD